MYVFVCMYIIYDYVCAYVCIVCASSVCMCRVSLQMQRLTAPVYMYASMYVRMYACACSVCACIVCVCWVVAPDNATSIDSICIWYACEYVYCM